MSIFSNYATNSEKEVNGVAYPVGFTDDNKEISFVIARLGGSNKQYLRALEHAQKPYRRPIQLGTMDKDLHEKLLRDVFAVNCVKGWSNVQDEEGKDIPYTAENSKMLLERLPNLYDDLFAQSQNMELFRNDVIEEDTKN